MMLCWKSIVQDYIIKYSDQMRKVTETLKIHFGISYFTYHKIDAVGNYTVLVNRPDWAEHYVDKKIFSNDPFLQHPSVYHSGIYLFNSLGSREYRRTIMRESKQILDADIGVMFIQKEKEKAEFFGFSGNRKTSLLQHICLNQTQILQSFAKYFKENLAMILKIMEEEKFSLIDLKKEKFFCKNLTNTDEFLEKRKEYYKDLGLTREIEKAAVLSLRERQCLHLLVQGNSSKETAKISGLSPRTIEFYFENIKKKLLFWNKQELFQFAKKMKELDLL